MSQRNQTSPTADVVAKKLFNDSEITKDFIEAFLGLKPKVVKILNGTLSDLRKERAERGKHFSTMVDVLAELDDNTQVIIEIQVAQQDGFIKRLWTYSCQHLVKDLPNVREKVERTHDMYDKIRPIYSIALVESQYFVDSRPIHSFVISDEETKDTLMLPFGEEELLREPFRMTILELKKFQSDKLTSKQRFWFEFFANEEFSSDLPDVIKKAEDLLDREKWSEEEKEMFENWQRQVSAHFDELKTAERQGARNNALETATALILDGFDDEKVVKYSKLPLSEVIALRKSLALSGV